MQRLGGQEKIEFYDDQEPGFVHIYAARGHRRHFVRSVDKSSAEHCREVCGAWAARGGFVDNTKDKQIKAIFESGVNP